MKTRSLDEIQKKLTEQYKVWRRGGEQSQPPLEGPPSGGVGGGGDIYGLGGRGGSPMQIDIGLGGAGKASSINKPRVNLQRAKELGVVKPDPKVWRRGEETPAPAPAPAMTPKEKLAAQAQAQAQATGKPVLTVEPGSLASRALDKMFPAPSVKKEPYIPKSDQKSSEPELRAEPRVKDKETEVEKNARNARYWRNTLGATGVAATAGVGYGLKKAYDAAKEKAQEYFPSTAPVNPPAYQSSDDIMSYDTKNEAQESQQPSHDKDQYLRWAKSYADQYGVPMSLVLHAMYNETGWLQDPAKMATAKSPTGARGVMQIQPEYAEKGYGIKVKDLTDPQKNIEAGVRGLSRYLQQYKTPEKALAAYNAGPGGASKFIQTGDLKFLKPETRKYIMNYKDDVIHNLQKFYPKDNKKIAQIATDLLGVAVGAKTAQAKPVSKVNEPTNNEVPAQPTQPAAKAPAITPTKTLKISKDQAQNLPPVDVFGHIFPSIDWNKQGGIGGISTKPYTLPDGTVITDKRALQNIRSLQQQPKSQTVNKPVDKKPADLAPAKDVQAVSAEPAAEKPLSKTAVRALSDFEKAFATARSKGEKEFTWQDKKGKPYQVTTKLKGEKSDTQNSDDLAVKNADIIDQANTIQQMQRLKVTPQLESINTTSDLEQILILAGKKK